jgi:hypothetical protein
MFDYKTCFGHKFRKLLCGIRGILEDMTPLRSSTANGAFFSVLFLDFDMPAEHFSKLCFSKRLDDPVGKSISTRIGHDRIF